MPIISNFPARADMSVSDYDSDGAVAAAGGIAEYVSAHGAAGGVILTWKSTTPEAIYNATNGERITSDEALSIIQNAFATYGEAAFISSCWILCDIDEHTTQYARFTELTDEPVYTAHFITPENVLGVIQIKSSGIFYKKVDIGPSRALMRLEGEILTDLEGAVLTTNEAWKSIENFVTANGEHALGAIGILYYDPDGILLSYLPFTSYSPEGMFAVAQGTALSPIFGGDYGTIRVSINYGSDVPAIEYVGRVFPSNSTPLMDGTASAGSSDAYAREDHVHPTDTTRQAKLTGTKGQIVGFDESGAAAAQDDKAVMLEKVQATLPSSANWRSVTYGNGKFVAVANDSNAAAYSTDGINWTAATLPSSTNWQSVTYGNGKFVAVANDSNVAAYSTDGITWTETKLPRSSFWQSVTYGNGKFVAVATASNVAAYSTDGINWTATTMPRVLYLYSVVYGNGKFVAVANDSNAAAYSTDGITWTETKLPRDTFWTSVAYGNGKFVAVVASNVAAYSTDGITWTETKLPRSSFWQSVTYGNGKFVAVATGSNAAAYSTDGINWTATTLPSSANWRSVTYGNGKFVAVATGSNAAAYSTDGITWQDSALYLLDSSDEDITDTVAELIQPKLDLSGKLDKSGGTMTGNVKFNDNANLFFGNEAEGMFYVDSSVLILLCEYGLKIDAHVLRLISNEATLNNQPIAVKPKATLVTLSTSGWTDNTQTVTVSGVLADETKQLIQVMPASASAAAYYGAGVYGSGQAANKLTFTCDSVPTADLSVYVTVQDVNYS